MNERDYPDPPKDDEEDLHPLDWEFVDEDGEDVFDRVGILVFGGSGWICSLYRGIICPSLQTSRSFYRGYVKDIMTYIMIFMGLIVSYELFGRRRIQDYFCYCEKASSRSHRNHDEDEQDTLSGDQGTTEMKMNTQAADKKVEPVNIEVTMDEITENFYKDIANEKDQE